MNSNRLLSALTKIPGVATQESRFYHVSRPLLYPGQDWRFKKGLARNSNAYGAMTDLPDYTFLDGRRTPAGTGRVQRAKFQH